MLCAPHHGVKHPFFNQLPKLTGQRDPGPGSGVETSEVTKDKWGTAGSQDLGFLEGQAEAQHSPAASQGPSTASGLCGAAAAKERSLMSEMSLLRGRSPVPSRTPRMGLGPNLSTGVQRAGPPPPGHTYLPGVGQAADGRVAEAKHYSKEGIEVLLFLEAGNRRTRDPQGKQPHPQSPTSRQHPGLGPTTRQVRPGLPFRGLEQDGMGRQSL